ncbi:hypothetical protein TNCT_652351 [Trichonephila clavata]|uniref:Uncharacterized protein n=1 Tax=Trichonephila clavata TaxID=2740835 RepID=A0A8X6KRD6_TRICU|nr:hypothetical protein TNCT_652351 [Trichonephila clavata]
MERDEVTSGKDAELDNGGRAEAEFNAELPSDCKIDIKSDCMDISTLFKNSFRLESPRITGTRGLSIRREARNGPIKGTPLSLAYRREARFGIGKGAPTKLKNIVTENGSHYKFLPFQLGRETQGHAETCRNWEIPLIQTLNNKQENNVLDPSTQLSFESLTPSRPLKETRLDPEGLALSRPNTIRKGARLGPWTGNRNLRGKKKQIRNGNFKK